MPVPNASPQDPQGLPLGASPLFLMPLPSVPLLRVPNYNHHRAHYTSVSVPLFTVSQYPPCLSPVPVLNALSLLQYPECLSSVPLLSALSLLSVPNASALFFFLASSMPLLSSVSSAHVLGVSLLSAYPRCLSPTPLLSPHSRHCSRCLSYVPPPCQLLLLSDPHLFNASSQCLSPVSLVTFLGASPVLSVFSACPLCLSLSSVPLFGVSSSMSPVPLPSSVS